MKKINVSKHSRERCKERLGLSKNCVQKKAENALLYGISHKDASGSLKRYIGYLYESHYRKANNILIYQREAYIFKDTKLITIFHIPKQYHAISDKLQKQKIEKGR